MLSLELQDLKEVQIRYVGQRESKRRSHLVFQEQRIFSSPKDKPGYSCWFEEL